MDKREELLNIILKDPYNLLKVEEESTNRGPRESALRNNFEEIVDFFEAKGHEPKSNLDDIYEFQLYCRLKKIRSTPKMVKELKSIDFYGLLNDGKELSLDDVIKNDPFGLLDDDSDESIFTLKNVKNSGRLNPDYIARRKKCVDFEEYKVLFDTLHEELENGKRKLSVYKSEDLKVGGFYVLNGILVYLKSVDGEVSTYKYESGDRDRFDGRTVCVFDNGTYSEMLFRSLDKALQKDGYGISDLIEAANSDQTITENDLSLGYIYVLRSMRPEFRQDKNIFKIGCTKTSVSERIKNAKNEATYLFADVEIVATYRCYNVSSMEVEQSIHTFLDAVRLDISIPEENGTIARPKEWFRVSLPVIDEIVQLLENKTINDYVYDKRTDCILKK